MSSSDDIRQLWEEACDKYEDMLPPRRRRDALLFRDLKQPEDLENHLLEHEKSFKRFRSQNSKLTGRLKACMRPFLVLSDMLSAAVSASPFAPASTILGAVCFVLKAADGVSEIYDWIEELFEKLLDFTVRLELYIAHELPGSLRSKIVGVLGCLLEILACAELAIKDGRWKKFAAVLFLGDDKGVKVAFDKLAELFKSEQSLVEAINFATNQRMDKRIEGIATMTETLFSRSNRAEEERLRHDVLNWISGIDYTEQQSTHLGHRQANTGLWFLDEPEYDAWVNGDQHAWALFCHGAPGAGKTTMSATIIDSLSMSRSPDAAVAYIYCNYQSRNEQSIDAVLTSLLRRLVQIRSTIPQSVLEAFQKFGRSQRLTRSQCIEYLGLTSKQFSKIFLVVDALDECDAEVMGEFIQTCSSLRKQSNIRLFMTARLIPSIQRMIKRELGETPHLEIRARDHDIREYFNSRRTRFKYSWVNDASLCERACKKVLEASGGMFLLARLHVDQLATMVVSKTVEKALSNMFIATGTQTTNAYAQQYDLAMTRILGQSPDEADKARATLAWMTFTRRPLSPAELCHAIAIGINDDKDELDLACVPDVQDLISLCAGLVTIDDKARTVRLVHYTTQEYLERTHEKWLPGWEKRVAQGLVAYLSLNEFKTGGYQNEREYETRTTVFPLFEYAALNWAEHCQPFQMDLFDEILFLLEDEKAVHSFRSVPESQIQRNVRSYTLGTSPPLLIIVDLGFDKILRKFLDAEIVRPGWEDWLNEDIRPQDNKTTLLRSAISHGYVDIIRLLLQREVGPSLEFPVTEAVVDAAMEGQASVIEAILDTFVSTTQQHGDAPVEISYSCGRALAWWVWGRLAGAWDRAGLAIPTKLLAVPIKAEVLNTVLEYALALNDEGLIDLLIKKGAEMSCTFHEAAHRGWVYGIRVLLAATFNIDALDEDGNTALQIAVIGHHEDVVRLLLNKHKEIGSVPGIMLVGYWMTKWVQRDDTTVSMLRALHEHGVNLDFEGNGKYEPAIFEAARCGNSVLLECMLNLGANVNAQWSTYGSVLHVALAREHAPYHSFEGGGHLKCVQILLEHGCDLNASCPFYNSTLQAAFYGNRDRLIFEEGDIALPLLERGVAIPENGPGLLRCAIEYGCADIARYLIKGGVDVHTAITHPNPFVLACQSLGPGDVFEVLYESGVDLEQHGPAALYEAIALGYPEGVRWLLEHGVDANAQGEEYPNALIACVSNGCNFAYSPHGAPRWIDTFPPYYNDRHLWHRYIAAVLRALVEHGADVDTFGPAAQELAVENWYTAEVRRLLGAKGDLDERWMPDATCPRWIREHTLDRNFQVRYHGAWDNDESVERHYMFRKDSVMPPSVNQVSSRQRARAARFKLSCY
ncbi:hypothetical protein FB567DRAFT_183203 [Paraphoma chrysanthemicola]|uniref:NACHT domain-containing protein n=1 Tax=Paraphoma chrysanthemicola TaxID=798071 RepID=A0A8K0QYG2_9PLEO|nr:hypothetical protein FB567DRAFT_183203 [Paraphoma chrysanthemicola]